MPKVAWAQGYAVVTDMTTTRLLALHLRRGVVCTTWDDGCRGWLGFGAGEAAARGVWVITI
eukprot:701767-Pyramimonas_sp.AAC.1